jgi:hypothetical protein
MTADSTVPRSRGNISAQDEFNANAKGGSLYAILKKHILVALRIGVARQIGTPLGRAAASCPRPPWRSIRQTEFCS